MFKKDSEFSWYSECDKSFLQLKKVLTKTPILRGLNWGFPFHIHIDASDYAIRVVLGEKEGAIEHAIYFISKNLQGEKFNYTMSEKDSLAIIYMLNKFRHYITGYEIFVHTDHSTIKYLMNKPVISGRVAKWLFLMQEFDITIVDKPRKVNVVADFLLSTQNPWYDNIENYLTTGKTPNHFSSKERKLLADKSLNFSWIARFMFYTSPNQVMHKRVREDETYDILWACYDDPCGDHLLPKDQHSKS